MTGSASSKSSAPAGALVIKPSSFGDVIHALPAVRALRRAWPKARIRWLIQPAWAPLLEGNPDIDGTLPFPRETFRGPFGPVRFLRWARSTARKFRPDLAVDLQGLLRSALAARLLGAREIAGASDAREGAALLHTRTIKADAGDHAVRRYLAVAAALGGIPDPVEFPLPEGIAPSLPPGCPQRFFVLHPYARGAGKSLDAAAVQALCRSLAPNRVVVVGQSIERPPLPENAVDLTGSTTLGGLIWLARHATVFLSVDSGPMHLAAAAGTPVVGIHTWSDPRKVGPWSRKALVWQSGEIHAAADYLDGARQAVPGGLPSMDDLDAIAAASVGLARTHRIASAASLKV